MKGIQINDNSYLRKNDFLLLKVRNTVLHGFVLVTYLFHIGMHLRYGMLVVIGTVGGVFYHCEWQLGR